MKLLHIDSSALGDQSASRRLTAEVVKTIRGNHADVDVSYRDFDRNPPAHLTAALLGAESADPATLSDALRADARYSSELLAEFLASDVIVLGAPMYNFSIPTPLKAWIDRIVKAGITFSYTEAGPTGLATGKQLIIVSSRGGKLPEGSPVDHQEAYLRSVFGLIGVTDVTVVRADGLAYGPDAAKQSLDTASRSIATAVAVVANDSALAA